MRIPLTLNHFENWLAIGVFAGSMYFSNSVLLSTASAIMVWLMFKGFQSLTGKQEASDAKPKTFNFKTIKWSEVKNERMGKHDT